MSIFFFFFCIGARTLPFMQKLCSQCWHVHRLLEAPPPEDATGRSGIRVVVQKRTVVATPPLLHHRAETQGFVPWPTLTQDVVLTSTVMTPMTRMYAAAGMKRLKVERERRKKCVWDRCVILLN